MILKDLVRRLIVSAIAISITACLLIFAFNPWFQFVVASVVALLTCVAIWEYGQFAKAKGGQMILSALIGISACQVLSFFLSLEWFGSISLLPLLVFFVGFLILNAMHFKQKEGALVDLAFSAFGLLYIAVPMGMLLAILYGTNGQDGRWWVAYLLVVTKITDIGAYFGGSLWGRRKLAPMISPGKTIEGAIVGLACAVAASFAFYLLSMYSGAIRFQLGGAHWLWMGLVLGCIGQFGDLSESLLKRDANKKDSNALPGLGGVLDLIDSLLFNAFIVYVYLNYTAIP